MARRLTFQNDPIGNMIAIGAVASTSARIWGRVTRAGTCRLRWSAADDGAAGSCDFPVRDCGRDLTHSVEIVGLRPNTCYRVALCSATDEAQATGSFTTAPRPGELPLRFSIALMSCHQPFDGHGRVHRNTEPMLQATLRAFRRHDVRQVILAGDQMYTDYPPRLSLFEERYFASVAPAGRSSIVDCDRQQVRTLLHDRYRHFWNLAGWRELLGNFPCHAILDDHDIVDNWGSALEHEQPRWQAFRAGALDAYRDYQGALVQDRDAAAPGYLDYQVEFADTATYVMDLRSNRRVGDRARIYSAAQLQSLRQFLHTQRDKSVLFLVLSVPLIHLPRTLSRVAARITPDGEDFSDRWSTRGHRSDRDRLLRMIHSHQATAPHQHIVLLSGDIHIGCLHQIRWRDSPGNFFQFISSGVTHDPGRYIQILSSLIMRANRTLVVQDGATADLELLRGEAGASRNPCGRLNVGIVEISRESAAQPPQLRFLLYSHRGSEPVCLYRSPAIGTTRGVISRRVR